MQVMKGNKVIFRWRMLENKTMNISRTQTQTYLKCSFASWNWSWPNCMKPACCRIRLCKICASRKGQKMRKSCLSLEKNTNDQVNQLSFTFYIKVQLSLLYHKTSIFIWPLTQMLHISHKKPKKHVVCYLELLFGNISLCSLCEGERLLHSVICQ